MATGRPDELINLVDRHETQGKQHCPVCGANVVSSPLPSANGRWCAEAAAAAAAAAAAGMFVTDVMLLRCCTAASLLNSSGAC